MLSPRNDEEVRSLEGQSLILGNDLVVVFRNDIVSHIVQDNCSLKIGVRLDFSLFAKGAGQNIIWELISTLISVKDATTLIFETII